MSREESTLFLDIASIDLLNYAIAMFQKLKHIQDLRAKAKTMQHALSQIVAEGSGGWGKCKISLDGTYKIRSIYIHPEARLEAKPVILNQLFNCYQIVLYAE